ncbi:DNA primase [Curtanaerobium respiraculi]|uniref:DNA primase n=1 Tax=Curtanaerobium respiraculi TaxID=2949669 RepID=UPI0024B34FF6|nr:DNA primase [Curtanaerobium respiraculi]
MAGISNEDIERVREATDIVSLFQDRCVLKQRGREFWCCCPFHEEKSPSCKIDPNTQRYYCFGCHESGDVFTFVMKTEDVDFPDAVRRLADRANIEIKETGRGGAPRSYKERLRGVCRETRDFYHLQLMRGASDEAAAARAYLAGRDLGGRVPKDWQLGFAPGRGALVRHLLGRGYQPKEMIDANVAVDRNGRAADRFYGRIMFPINDDRGETIAFGGRIVGQGEPKYLNSQTTPLFSKSSVLYGLDRAKAQITATGTALVVEGYTDVIALHEAGIGNAVATLGTALTTQHIRSISRHAAKKIVYLFDGDEAGQRATDRALQFIDEDMTPEAGKHRIDLLACTLPDDLDPADFVGRFGSGGLLAALEGAKPLIEFGIDRHIDRFDTGTPEGRTAAFADAIQILAPIKDSLLAKDYAIMIAGRLMMRENDALARLERLKPPRRPQPRRQGDGPLPGGPPSAGDAVPSDDGSALADDGKPPLRLPEAETSRRRYEAEFIAVCACNPAIGLDKAGALAQVAWHVPQHAQAADALLAALQQNPNATAAQVSVAIAAAVPSAGAILARGGGEGRNPHALADFLSEELALGDIEAQIDSFTAQLKSGSLSEGDEGIVYAAVSSLQRELIGRRARHLRADPGIHA